MSVAIERKVLKSGLMAVLVKLDDEEGMTLTEVSDIFGIPKNTIQSHMKSNGFKGIRFSVHQLKHLRDARVIPLNTTVASFIPQGAIESLVRFISTPETDAIYRELWDRARYSEQDLQNLEMKILQLEKKLTYIDDYAVDHCLAKGYRSHHIMWDYPQTQEFARQLSEENANSHNKTLQKWTLKHKTMPAMVSLWLRNQGIITELRWDTRRGDTNIYNRADIDRFMQALGIPKAFV